MKSESFFALLAGTAAGFALGLLFAPEKGEQTRQKVKAAAAEGWENLSDAASEGVEQSREAVREIRDEARDVRARILEQLDRLESAIRGGSQSEEPMGEDEEKRDE